MTGYVPNTSQGSTFGGQTVSSTIYGTVLNVQRTDVMNGGADEFITPKYAKIDAATSGDNTLVAAVASRKIRVLALFVITAGTVTVRFESGAGGTPLTGQMELTAQSGFVLPFSPVGWFETASNTLLNLELSAAISADGCLVYIEV